MNQESNARKKEVLERLKALYAAFSRKDIEAILSFFAPDPNVVVIGAAEDERVLGLDGIRKIWQRLIEEPVRIDVAITWHNLVCRETIAWFCLELRYTMQMDDEATLNLMTRGSGVMEKRDGDWLICQYHASRPTPALSTKYSLDYFSSNSGANCQVTKED